MIEEFGSGLFVGHQDILADVQSSILGPGGGALVTAEPGMGKSALAKAAVDALGVQVHPLWIYAEPSLSAVPFGALVPHLGPITAAESGSVLAAMRSLMAGIRCDCPAGRPVLMVIDDAQYLDRHSAVLVAQLVSSGAAKLLALGTVRPPVPQELLSLVSDQLLARHTLRPLTKSEAGRLCREVLGGQILGATSAALWAAAGGIPVFVLALLAQSRRAGNLVERNGVWMLVAEPGPPEPRLVDLVKTHLGQRSVGTREALETVALMEPLPLQVLLGSAAGAHVDELAEDGLITVTEDRRRLVRTAHPLYAEVIRRTVPASRSLRLRQQVLAVPGQREDARTNLLRLVDWSLDRGLQLPEGQLLRAARLANDGGDNRLALKAAAAVHSATRRAAAQVQLGRAHAGSGDYRQALRSLDGVLEEARDLYTAASAAQLAAAAWLHGAAGAPGLEETAARWSAAVDRMAPQADCDARLARWSRAGVRLMQQAAKVAAGEFTVTDVELAAIVDEQEGFAECAVVARVLAAAVLIGTGRAESGVRLTAQALELARQSGPGHQPFREVAVATHVLGLIRQGRTEETLKVLASAGAGPEQVRSGGAAGLAAAIAAFRHTGPDSALGLLRPATEALQVADSLRLLPFALGAGAYVAALAGDAETADEYLARFGPVRSQGSPQLRLLSRGYAAAAAFLRGGRTSHLAELRQAADAATRRGWTSAEIELRSALVRVGDLGAVDGLMKATDGAEGPLAAALNSMARALMAADVRGLAALREAEHGTAVLALAVDALKRSRLVSGAPAAYAGLAKDLLPALEKLGLRPGAGRKSATDAKPAGTRAAVARLTERERDIAELVLRGLKNTQIAERLCLSVRTVEGHIYRAFAKLGINRRDELTPEMLAAA